jgi:hypothetical protein
MGLNIGGIIGGIVGSMLGIPGGAALGAGLGAKATGASDKEAMMYGLGGLMLGGGGAGKAGGFGKLFGSGGAGLAGFLGKDKIGNAMLMSSLASGVMGVMNPPSQGDPFALDNRMKERWNAIDAGDSTDYMDPETGEHYASIEERDAAMEARGSTYNQAQYRPAELAPLYGDTTYAATGGYIQGPGTGTSDSVPAMIYQNGGPVRQAALSDGEFVMTNKAVQNMGGGNRDVGAARMYQLMNSLEGRRNS